MRLHRLLPVLAGSLLASASAAYAQQPVSHQFELLPSERTSVQFMLTAAGRLQIDVQSRGDALVSSVTGPDGQVQEQSGAGAFSLAIDVPGNRVEAGNRVWIAALRPARAAAAPAANAVVSARPAAAGTLLVRGALASEAAMTAALAPQLATQRARAEAAQRAAVRVSTADLAEPLRASLAQRTATVHAQQLQAITARLSPATQAMMQQRGGTSVARIADPAKRPGAVSARMRPGVGSSGGAATGGASAVGSGGGAAAAVAEALTLRTMSASQGDPGTPILFEGSGFGSTAGEVHFIVANGRDLKAPVTVWSTTQILSQVPAVDSVPAYNGYAYLQRADGSKSPLMPFAFRPRMAVERFVLSARDLADSRIGMPGEIGPRSVRIQHPDGPGIPWFGSKGYDEFFVSTRLRNGWQPIQFEIIDGYFGTLGPTLYHSKSGGVYVVETRSGTDSPYVKVRWWYDGGTVLEYRVAVTLQGPSGLPYR